MGARVIGFRARHVIRFRYFARTVVVIAALLTSMSFAGLPSPIPAQLPVLAAPADCLNADEALLLDRINTWRVLRNLPPLAASPTLVAAARHHAESMATFSYFPDDYQVEFEGPDQDETISWQRNIANAGYPDNTHTVRGAIIGAGTGNPSLIYRLLTERSSYASVLSDKRFTAIGIGFGSNPDSDEGNYWTLYVGSFTDDQIEPCEGVTYQIPIQAGGRSGNSNSSMLAFDGDLSTSWATTTEDVPERAYLWFDFGSIHDITSIEWMMSDSETADAFTIEVSFDGETWMQIAEKGNGDANEWRTLRWSGSTRFVRFTFANPNGDPVIGNIVEVRFFA